MKLGRLRLLHDDGRDEVNIFIHGYELIAEYPEPDQLAEYIFEMEPRGKSYLLHWRSGAALACVPLVIRFHRAQLRAEELGKTLLRRVRNVTRSRSTPVNLWGHSLGARAIHWSLSTSDWSSVNLRNVVLMGGATDATDLADWRRCVSCIRGRLYNCYSKADTVLSLYKPDWELTVGIAPIALRMKKVVNRRYCFAHTEYWQNLAYIADRILPNRLRGRNVPRVEPCPNPDCATDLFVTPATTMICPDCGTEFRF